MDKGIEFEGPYGGETGRGYLRDFQPLIHLGHVGENFCLCAKAAVFFPGCLHVLAADPV